jgi:hypothetical protein
MAVVLLSPLGMSKVEDVIISELENLRERIGRLRADITTLKQLSPSLLSKSAAEREADAPPVETARQNDLPKSTG